MLSNVNTNTEEKVVGVVGVVGLGVVGNAMFTFLKTKVNALGYDKYNNNGNIKDFVELLKCDILFLVLPTLYSEELISYDKTAIYETCENLKASNYKGTVVLKSTVEPETTEYLSSHYGLSIIHNPEFLSASTAYDDFSNQNHIVLGKTKNIDDYHYSKVKIFYQNIFPDAVISECCSLESELMKSAVNNFYAIKVQFFSEIYLLCNKLGISFKTIKDLMLKNGWINEMHTNVPGPDGLISYGGMCFPKDTNSLRRYMEHKSVPCEVITACINERNTMRDD